MFKSKKIMILLFLFLFLSTYFINSNLQVNAEENELIHLVVLADISGSLNTPDTEALQQLIIRIPRFLDNEKLNQSKLTVVAFASEATQICDTDTIAQFQQNNSYFETCLQQIQATKKNNPNIAKRAQNVGLDTNQIKAFEKGLEITSSDPENYIPVFLLLTDGNLDPVGTGFNSKETIEEFDRGFEEVRPEMKNQSVQLFIFGFGDAKLEDLTKWAEFSSPRRSCQEEAPERIYPSTGDIFKLLIDINTAMNQVTCGEATELITLEPGEPKEFYVSDLVEELNIKIDLKGSSGLDAIVLQPDGSELGIENEVSDQGECIDDFITCYEITNPVSGTWTLSSSIYTTNAVTTTIIVADISFVGTYKITTDCEVTTLRDGFESCSFTLSPSRAGSQDLIRAIDSVSFDFIIDDFGIQERGSFYKDSLSLQIFRNLLIGSGDVSININPIYSELKYSDGFKWLQFIQIDNPTYSLNPLIVDDKDTEEVENPDLVIDQEETSFPWVLVIVILLILLTLFYLANKKKELPSGTIFYGSKNAQNRANLTFYGGTIKEYFDLSLGESTIEVSEGDKTAVNLLTLESVERRGLRFWDSSNSKSYKMTYEDLIESSIESVEILINEKFIVSFVPDQIEDDFDGFEVEEDGFEEFSFE